ncbi:hypothetical protein [Persicitalea jodogahamensis]|uniref:Uncharacterized protein n=1 Tax=Persicitalea jodogahamensis TaxID=402147 RepID=A0A8J3GAY3_9BACT|nr:hypothetical protein [Persicitalea jodogahamensis]GHB77472.1 hypothetical protein GCM10007390_34530 [Persicitalea jodogahamensis]
MKNTIISALFLLAISQIIAGCNSAKKVPYDAKWNAPFTYVDQGTLDGLDQQSRLRFGVINDDQFMYITLKTRDPLTTKQILTNGIRLTFSPENSREDRSILFPVVTRDDKKALSKMQIDLPNSLSLSRMMEAFNKEALWKDKQGERFINLVENQAGIRARIALDENQELTQQFSIPFAQLGVDPRQARMMEVGIKTEGSGNGLGGIAPGVSIGMGSGGFGGGGFGGGGISLGTGGGRNNPNDRSVNLRLQVRLAKDSFREDLR